MDLQDRALNGVSWHHEELELCVMEAEDAALLGGSAMRWRGETRWSQGTGGVDMRPHMHRLCCNNHVC
jgi:hypothetical protein